MLMQYEVQGSRLHRRDGMEPVGENAVWIDLLDPSAEEDAFVEKALGLSIPTRAEAREIEASSRLYVENGAHFMTAFVIYNLDAPIPRSATLTFILVGSRLVTLRYSEPRAFPMFLTRVDKGDAPCNSGTAIAIGLIETIIDRQADVIERIQDEIERQAPSVFEIKGGQQTRNRRLDVLLKVIGKQGDITSRAQESAFSIDRLLTFFAHAARERKDDQAISQRIETAQRDIASLTEQMRFLVNRITFLLEATLGTIATEQNQIIKLFSVVSVMLMPPTLVASIYGMNFAAMPELQWPWGYPMALGLMVLSAVVPYYFFRRRGWL